VTVEWPESTSEVVVEEEGASAAVLFGLAVAYQAAQSALMERARAVASNRWFNVLPVTDDDLGGWMSSWDSQLDLASRQQARLTATYVDGSLRGFGARPGVAVVEPPAGAVEAVVDWLDSDYAELDDGLHREAEALLRRLQGGRASVPDLARADRLPWLHSPVVKVRAGLSAGVLPVEQVFESVAGSLDATTDAALRSVEGDVITATRWPRFRNGRTVLAKRLPQAGACGWCRVVATRLYAFESKEGGRQWHNDCRCTWALVTFAEATTYQQKLKGSGDYYEAARSLGLWVGPGDSGVIGERSFDPNVGPSSEKRSRP